MPLTYRLQRATRLKLELRTDNKIGVGRAGGCELIPNTPSACKRLGFEVTTEQFRNDFNLDLLKDLRAYQKEDAIFLAQRKNAGCFNQQRTGKTPTSLLSLKLKGCKKVLIVYQLGHQYYVCMHLWFYHSGLRFLDIHIL